MKSAYVRSRGRLAQYCSRASVAFWEDNWSRISEHKLRHVLRPTGRLGKLTWLALRYLPRQGVIVEAGCGTGLWVRRLRYRRYDCVGIDYAIPSLVRSKVLCPELPLLGGSVLQLPLADASLGAYLSFGVIEHFKDGPGEALREAARVLRRGGVAFISVPYLNRVRRNVRTVRRSEAISHGLEFYQYYFSEEDLKAELERAGFTPKGRFRYQNVYNVLKGRLPLLRKLAKVLPGQRFWMPILDFVPGLPPLAAHMILAVAIKR